MADSRRRDISFYLGFSSVKKPYLKRARGSTEKGSQVQLKLNIALHHLECLKPKNVRT
jgi:hypothetical protein